MRARASGNRYRAVSTGSRALPRRASFGGARSQISSRILVSRRGSAASILLNPLGLMVRLVLKIMRFTEVPDRYKVRLNARWDPVSNKYYLDMRMLLAARLLALNRKKAVKAMAEVMGSQAEKRENV